ncbi:uncharacterized protein BX663DRAFT_552610 [Cokeromyces recurvatus]|uniref:uncharacterized protein n=1 Tax=Cokeromyces recurvatus TaxID=90255 RepID=UPI00221E98ED|nr:uncharacterized protein BX663DRAFT_552610 [Cokeromyces recurvatus]KAI7902188.1 hypothetical protein BX663DRAFT_552610 [Cokeromyces recurvatus]
MEQKPKILKRSTKKDSSKTHSDNSQRYSLRNKKESSAKPVTRSQKRKIEREQHQTQEISKSKKTKMDSKVNNNSKGKQKVQEKITSKKSDNDDKMQDIIDNTLKSYHNKHEDDKEENDNLMHYDDEGHDDWEDSRYDEENDHNGEEDDEDENDDINDDDDDDEDDDDDDDEPDNESEIARVRRTLGFGMQGLLGGIMSSDFTRFKTILNNLKDNDDPTMQLIALQELAEILSVSSEDNLAGYFSSDSFSRELVRIMKGQDDLLYEDKSNMDEDMMLALAMSEGFSGGNPEVMLLACRCISNLLEAMPTAVTSVVSHGAIHVLCQKLKSIQYIDLAEQALYALEKISAQLPRAVVHEGGLSAVLMYFDFFSIHAQRTALRTAANCMRGIDADAFSQVLEVTPTLMNTITYSDRSLVELTCLCWVRISESYRTNREFLERAITVELLKTLFGLIPVSGNSNAVHPAAFQDLLRIFRSISKASPQLSFELLKLGIIETFYCILTGASSATDFSNTTVHPHHHITLDSKWRDSVPNIIKIIVDLLPPLPKDTMFSSRRFKAVATNHTTDRTTHSNNNTSLSESQSTKIDPRIQWFNDNPDILLNYDHVLIPIILDLYSSTVNLRVRQLVTHILVKLLHYSTVDTLSKVLKNISLSSFLSGLLTRQEHPVLMIDALYQVELLIQKLPQLYYSLFEREGVLHEVESLSKLPFSDEEDHQQQSQQSTQLSEDNDDDSTNSKKDDDYEEDNKTNRDNKTASKRSSSAETGTSSGLLSPTSSSSQHKMFDSNDLQAMMRSHHFLYHQQRLSRHHQHQHQHHHNLENEKGIGRGSTRKYIIQLAQYFVNNYFNKELISKDGTAVKSAGNSLKEITNFANKFILPTNEDPVSKQTLVKLSNYLRESAMGISSFELLSSGLLKALLLYLTSSDMHSFKASREDRIQSFKFVFVEQPSIDHDGNSSFKKLVIRLQEILSRFEAFDVVTPLESSSNDGLRNPTSMLAKQLRLKLTGIGNNIPSTYKQLMVSTHAVATFRVLEEYLLARIGASEENDDTDEEDEEDEIEEHLLIEEDDLNLRDGMDLDSDSNDVDTEMRDITLGREGSGEDEEGEEEPDDKRRNQKKGSKDDESSSHSRSSGSGSNVSKKEKKDGEWRIQFSLNGTIISNDSTVYAAAHQYEMNSENRSNPSSLLITPQSSTSRNIWLSSYPITYERIWVSKKEVNEKEIKKSSTTVVRQLADIPQPKELTEDSICSQVLQLLKALSSVINNNNNNSNMMIAQDFINRKLTAKANRQLEEPLIVASSCLPTWLYWLMSEAPFLFPFEVRYLFIQSTSFGYARLIARWQSLQMRNNTQNGTRTESSDHQPVLGRMERQKVRIMRSQMLESAVKILDLFGSSPTVLEIEYMGEEGTGMGPTLEFYASTSKEFSRHSLNMWRGSIKSEKGYVNAPHGLFPKTLTKSSTRSAKKIIQLFKTLGQFIAKGLLDFRIIDIPFSPAFFKVALDHVKPSPELLMEIDPQLAKSIDTLQSYIKQKREIYADNTKSAKEKSEAVKNIKVDGAKIEDLCLDFILPGDDSYELKTGGLDIPVTINNVEEYIHLVLDAIAGSGISKQIAAFREGFNGLFAIDDLKLLTHTELVSLFGKAEEDWSYAVLTDSIRADHGFTMESEPVRYLFEILSEFNQEEKRQFLQFTTGSPRLPIGGWKALRPVFTVVRKIPEAPLTPDDYLPSVMTCANYLKMPAYTSKEIMRQRFLTSIKEGQNSFLLS